MESFLRTGTYIMCAKFRENKRKTAGGEAIWKSLMMHIHTERYTVTYNTMCPTKNVPPFHFLNNSVNN